MTQITQPAIPGGLTPEQVQAILAYLAQQSSGASNATAESPPTVDTPQGVTASGITAGIERDAQVAQGAPPTPVKTPPRRARVPIPPTTPKSRPNTTPMKIIPPSPATNTPSSKMAQLTLDGRKLSATPSLGGEDAGDIDGAKKKVLPNGYDPALVFEEVDDNPRVSAGGKRIVVQEDDDKVSSISDEFPANPLDNMPKVQASSNTAAKPAQSVTSGRGRRKRNEPTEPRWINTRHTISNHEPSPTPERRSPKKNPRPSTPTGDADTIPAVQGSPKKKARIASPFESPPQAKKAASDSLEAWLAAAPPGISVPTVKKALRKSSVSAYVDDEAMHVSEEDGSDESGSSLGGFIQPDNVVEYDDEAPALPDDEDRPRKRRIYRRSSPDDDEESGSEVEIVPTPNKGKERAKDWKVARPPMTRAPRGLHPGSSPADANASTCTKLTIDYNDLSTVFTYNDLRSYALDAIDYYSGVDDVPAGCALLFSDVDDNGWQNLCIDQILDPAYVNTENLFRGLKFYDLGPYINDSLVSPNKLVAVDVSGSSPTPRYRITIAKTRAPAVSITACVVWFWRLDQPSTGARPVFYINVNRFFGLFERSVALQCMTFGQPELNCLAFRNAVRIACLPAFDRPMNSGRGGKTSSAIRSSGASRTTRRAAPFEPTTNDSVIVYDARKVELPQDISTWTTVLPQLEGPLPPNAIAFVAHTTNLWIGNRSTTEQYNIQYNLMFVVVVGVVPPYVES